MEWPATPIPPSGGSGSFGYDPGADGEPRSSNGPQDSCTRPLSVLPCLCLNPVAMCLRQVVDDPSIVLSKGDHLGLEWVVTRHPMGHRCGYVRVPLGHPWYGEPYDDLTEVKAHGNINFSEADVPCEAPGPDTAWWIGFDCAHWGNAPDPALAAPPFAQVATLMGKSGGRVRSQLYVEQECMSICEQAALATVTKTGTPNE